MRTITTEILLSLLLGAVPIILLSNQPDFSAAESLSSLNPGDIVLNYFLYLLCIHLVIWFLNSQVLKTNQSISATLQRAHEFTHKLGFAIHGVYRVIAGAVPAAIWFEIDKHGFVQGWQAITIFSVVLSISSFIASVALAKATNYTAPRVLLFGK
ncbi:hypothetical protein NB469_14695 [Vibrio alginolyticus]|uniref:hypothetical protein n=1 Tax=Vibrio alginolyticus TaxID=663 RepID=UPI00215CC261|nr:hypothetical protein [Vibrio alginolyticus]MCR9519638.1 hypothetical protein [Vibrio alginolyticus]